MSRERGAIAHSLARKGIPPPMYISREKVWLAYIQSRAKRGLSQPKVRGVSCDTPLFSWRLPIVFNPLFRKVLILGSTYTFQPNSFRSCWLNPWPLIRKFLSLWRIASLFSDLDRGVIFAALIFNVLPFSINQLSDNVSSQKPMLSSFASSDEIWISDSGI